MGPAGLATAIRLKQWAAEKGAEVSMVAEKGSEVGTHIISGAVMDLVCLNALVLGWQVKPDGVLTFDKLSSVFISNTNREEDQQVHLVVKDMAFQKSSEHDVFARPSNRYCPAGVYEWVEEEEADAPRFRSTRKTASTARRATSRRAGRW